MLAIVVGVQVAAIEVQDDLFVAVLDDHAVPVAAVHIEVLDLADVGDFPSVGRSQGLIEREKLCFVLPSRRVLVVVHADAATDR